MFGYFNDFINLLFPRICLACGANLQKNEEFLCMDCLYHLPKTNFHQHSRNPVEELFWGKTRIETAIAYYFFHKKSPVQNLMHELKYSGKKELGVFLGRHYGLELRACNQYSQIAAVIPVPLHPKKLKIRGYNQSEVFAEGLAQSLNVSIVNDVLYRNMFTETQTKKSRFERWANVSEKFDVKNYEFLRHREVFLVDDVITTGSTLEACAQALLRIEGIKIHVAALAFAHG